MEKWEARKSKRLGDKKGKSVAQEKRVAKSVGGKRTISSGALPFQKADVFNKTLKLRIECKRTDKEQIILYKKWLLKLQSEARFEVPVLHLEIQDEEWYLVRPSEFAYILQMMGLGDG